MVKSAIVTVMERAAQKAARSLRRDFNDVEYLQVSRKGPADFVSKADQNAEDILKEELTYAREDFGWVGEETGGTLSNTGQYWVVDPLDGTTNFLHGIPHFAISIAVVEEGAVTAGLVYDPIKDEMFIAEKGKGCTLNNRPIRTSGRDHLPDCLISTGAPFLGHGNQETFLPRISRVMARTSGIRRYGSAALDLAYVAMGRYDAFFEDHLNPWDIAAGSILVSEARGHVCKINGSEFKLADGDILATNSQLLTSMREILGG